MSPTISLKAVLILICGLLSTSISFAQGSVVVQRPPGQGETKPKIYWQGESGGFKIYWDEDVIKAKDIQDKVYLLGGVDKTRVLKPTPTPKVTPPVGDDGDDEDQSRNVYSLLSVVGPYGSILRRSIVQMAPTASTSVYLDFFTVRLDIPHTPVPLDALFPSEEIYGQLMQDKAVQKFISKLRVKKKPANLGELVRLFGGRILQTGVKSSGLPGEEGNLFPERLLESYSFHHIEKDKVAVRIHLPPAEAKFNRSIDLGILLAPPEKLAEDFKKAEQKIAGFLEKDAPRDAKKNIYETIEGPK